MEKNDDNTPVEELMLAYARSQKYCKVDLIDDNGSVIKTYESGKMAEQELNRAINDAEESRQQRASTMGGVLDLASAGMAYGKDYLTKSATEKATEQINAGGTGSGLSDMQERYPTVRPVSYGSTVYGNK